jgi:hypothetical protein
VAAVDRILLTILAGRLMTSGQTMTSELTGIEGVQLGIFLHYFLHSHLGKTKYIRNVVFGDVDVRVAYLVRHARSVTLYE